MKKKMAFCWSGGKDSAMALELLLGSSEYEVTTLLTNLSEEHRRISMHGIRESVLDEQMRMIGLPLVKVFIADDSMETYENQMINTLSKLKNDGIETIGFGDIFLEDLKTYREQQLAKLGIHAVFPLWKRNTRNLLDEFESKNFEARICSGDARFFDKDRIGSKLSSSLISQLGKEIDPCGENGEYHTLVTSTPYFKKKIEIVEQEKILRSYGWKDDQGQSHESSYWFCDFELGSLSDKASL